MADRLDNPLEKRRGFFRRPGSGGGDGFGRFAEATARFMGSPRFVLYMTIFVVAWITANLVLAGISVESAWDPYPFILLNLAFSTQASYSAPLIMLAQNRQDARDRVVAEQDRLRASRTVCAPNATWPTPSTSPARSPACAWPSRTSPRATSCAPNCATCSKTCEQRSPRTQPRPRARTRTPPGTPKDILRPTNVL